MCIDQVSKHNYDVLRCIHANRAIHKLLGVGRGYDELQLSLSSLPTSVMVSNNIHRLAWLLGHQYQALPVCYVMILQEGKP